MSGIVSVSLYSKRSLSSAIIIVRRQKNDIKKSKGTPLKYDYAKNNYSYITHKANHR